MKKNLITGMLILASAFFGMAQNLLTPTWKFHTGDSLIWANPSYNDSHWKEITEGIPWENQGYSGYDGFAWYSKIVVIPSGLKKQAEAGRGFLLTLGRIDDADYTYWNGELLAKTGDFPPSYVQAYDANRKCIVPLNKIRWDAPNVIAVRVFDNGGNGGMYTADIVLKPAGVQDYLTITPAFVRSDRIITGNAPIAIPLLVGNGSNQAIQGTVKISISTDFREPVTETSLKGKLMKKQQAKIEIPVRPPHINFAAYNQLNVPKEYIAYPEAGHGIPSEFHARKIAFIKVFGL